jgi:hypothetical protein
MIFNMQLARNLYPIYIEREREYLFDNQEMDSILLRRVKDHRTERFIDLYLLKSHPHFKGLYAMRMLYDLEENFNRTVSALYMKKRQSRICKQLCEMFIKEYGVTQNMITRTPEEFDTIQVIKGLDAFTALLLRTKKEQTASRELVH